MARQSFNVAVALCIALILLYDLLVTLGPHRRCCAIPVPSTPVIPVCCTLPPTPAIHQAPQLPVPIWHRAPSPVLYHH